MDIKRAYYAIIPADIRYDTDLTPNSKLLYGEITALCNEKGYCWASNSYFAKLYGVKTETISRWISQLRKKGYIDLDLIYKENTREILERRIYIITPPIDNKVNTPCLNNQDPIDNKVNTPIDEKVKDNNTLINNTINNTLYKDIVPSGTSSLKNDIEEIFNIYNEQKIIKHRQLTKRMKDSIKQALKKESKEELIKAIKRYGESHRDKRYSFSDFEMTLDKFMKQSNGYYDWLDEGQKYINYKKFKEEFGEYDKSSSRKLDKDNEQEGTTYKGIDLSHLGHL